MNQVDLTEAQREHFLKQLQVLQESVKLDKH